MAKFLRKHSIIFCEEKWNPVVLVDCHKTSYVRTIGFKSLADLTEEERKVLL